MNSLTSPPHLSRNERLIYIAATVSNLGNWLASLALFAWIYQNTKNPILLGLAIIIHRFPVILGAHYLFHPWRDVVRGMVSLDLMRSTTQLLMAVAAFMVPDPTLKVAAVFLLAGFRSFLSGPEAGLRAELIQAHFSDSSKQARIQVELFVLFAITGAAAGLFYFWFPVEEYRFEKIILLDAGTFFLSAIAISLWKGNRTERSRKLQDKNRPLHSLFNHPHLMPMIALHGFRLIITGLLFQLNISQVRDQYGLPVEYTGLFYLAPTLGWFFSAQLYKSFRGRLITTGHYAAAAVCISLLLYWSLSLQNPWIGFTLFFVCWTLDGYFLSDTNSRIQSESRAGEAGQVFNGFTWITGAVVVAGNMIAGAALKTLATPTAVGLISVGICALILLIWVLKTAQPDLFLLLRTRRIARQLGLTLELYFVKLPLAEYTKSGSFRAGEVCVQIADLSSKALLYRGSSVQTGSPRGWAPALSEAVERLAAEAAMNSGTVEVRTNGAAVHYLREAAELAAKRELIERDSVLFHHLLRAPATAKISETRNGYHADFYRNLSSDPDLVIITCIIVDGSDYALGWGAASTVAVALDRAFHEALASLHTFREALGRPEHTRAEAQTVGVLKHYRREDFQYLEPAEGGDFQGNSTIHPALVKSDEIRILEQRPVFNDLLYYAYAHSDKAFTPQWPFMERERTEEVFRRKGFPVPELRHEPCLIY